MAFDERVGQAGGVCFGVTGDGPPLVLLHPIGLDRSWWAPYVAHWSSRYRVIAIDLAGHGQSAPLRGPVTLADHARCVLDVLDSEGITSAVIMGVSMGGMVAQGVAIAAPRRVEGLVLCATAGAFPNAVRAAVRQRGDTSRQGRMSDVIDATVERWFTAGSPTPLVAACRSRLACDDWFSWSANWEAISELDNLEALEKLTLPAIVIAGDLDVSIPLPVSEQLARALKADHVVVAGSGHLGAFDSPMRFLPLIDPFLATVCHSSVQGRYQVAGL